jgi:hypothetical protein
MEIIEWKPNERTLIQTWHHHHRFLARKHPYKTLNAKLSKRNLKG